MSGQRRGTTIDGATIHESPLNDMRPETLYSVLGLRVDVFVVEQRCAYPELDGRDLDPGAILLWAERAGDVVATMRLVPESDGAMRIGRVATASSARSAGLAGELIRRALALAGPRDVVLDAQSRLEGWYSSFGFVRCGDDFTEDGIRHVPMLRRARQPAPQPPA
jgi:ElaA protein